MNDSNITSIINMLKRFKDTTLSEDDYKTTVRDILWNIQKIKSRTK